MASSFTITQPFLGAPLQFQPALGSQELDTLIDFYVPGTASKQDKLSTVTIDFYLNATVDINTGALTKTYNVFPSAWADPSFEQSPTESQSSGFSPAIYTPSPGSSATFGQDSGYASFTMTPPTKTRGGRVAKKAKKEVKKVDETRLPGFSILTKDGIDVTSTAGRGTKTKEQREHAHLMRIMKACDDCKKKKVRCDPSHRRSHNEMSRSSTSTSKSCSSHLNPSPTSSAPSLSRQTTQSSTPASLSPSNGIDDFILFPEGSDTWNPADLALETQDISEFNFDINALDYINYSPINLNSQSFDYSFSNQSLLSNSQSSFSPHFSDQYDWVDSLDVQLPQSSSSQAHTSGLPDQQEFLTVPHSRPHASSSSQDSGQLDSSYLGVEFVQPFARDGNSVLQSSQAAELVTYSPGFSQVPLQSMTLSSDELLGHQDEAVASSSSNRTSRSSLKRAAPHDEMQAQALASLQSSLPYSPMSDSPLILVDHSDPHLDGHTTPSSAVHANECGCGQSSNVRSPRPQGLFFPVVLSEQCVSRGLERSETENIPDYARDSLVQLTPSSSGVQSHESSQTPLLTPGSISSGIAVNANRQLQTPATVTVSNATRDLPLQQRPQSLSPTISLGLAILGFATMFAVPALQVLSHLQTISTSWMEAQHPFIAATSLIFCAALVSQIPNVMHSGSMRWIALAILGYLTGYDRYRGDDDCHRVNGMEILGDEFLDLFEEMRSCTVLGLS